MNKNLLYIGAFAGLLGSCNSLDENQVISNSDTSENPLVLSEKNTAKRNVIFILLSNLIQETI